MTPVFKAPFRATFGALALLVALGSVPAHAQPPAHPIPHGGPPPGGAGFAATPHASQDNPAGRAHVDLMVVYANHSGQVDPRAAKLKTTFGSMGFTGFQVLSTHDAQLSAGQDTSVNVEGGQKVQLTLVSRTDALVKVRIQVSRNGQKVLDTTASSPPGKALNVGGTNYQDGKLVFVIQAN